jgi:hypothetical protein
VSGTRKVGRRRSRAAQGFWILRYGGQVDRFLDDVLDVLKLLAGIGGAGKPHKRRCPSAGLAYGC